MFYTCKISRRDHRMNNWFINFISFTFIHSLYFIFIHSILYFYSISIFHFHTFSILHFYPLSIFHLYSLSTVYFTFIHSLHHFYSFPILHFHSRICDYIFLKSCKYLVYIIHSIHEGGRCYWLTMYNSLHQLYYSHSGSGPFLICSSQICIRNSYFQLYISKSGSILMLVKQIQ